MDGTVMFIPEKPGVDVVTETLAGDTEKSGKGVDELLDVTRVVRLTVVPAVPPNPFRLTTFKVF